MAKKPSATHTPKGQPKITHRKGNGQFKSPSIGSKPTAPAELDQDPGSGFNRDRTNPQQ